MVTTTWIASSGDWNTASNWTNGVPAASTDVVFPAADAGPVSGDGPAASLTVQGNNTNSGAEYSLGGTHAFGELSVIGNGALFVEGVVSFASAELGSPTDGSDGAISLYVSGAPTGGTLAGNGGITLAHGTLSGLSSVLSNAITLAAAGTVEGTGTISGLVSGPGALNLLGNIPPRPPLVLDNGANDYTGGTEVSETVEVAANGALGSGAVLISGGFLTLDAGVTSGPIVVAPGMTGQVTAVDADLTMFAGGGTSDLFNGSGSSTFVGATMPTPDPDPEPTGSYDPFGNDFVSGGTGRVTVFAGNAGGSFFGGTAGGNVVIAGADLSGYTVVPGKMTLVGGPYYVGSAGTLSGVNSAVIGGGGNGDLLVVTGTLNDLVAAAGGNETLTGASATGSNTFFGGTGADLIVAGAGHDQVVAGSGAETINAGTGQTAIFADSGSDLIVGGSGADYVQVGSGSATAFTGTGADLFAAVNGGGGGTELIIGFRVGTDQIAVRGYAGTGTMAGITNRQITGGSTVLTLADNTRITLQGVTSLGTSSFV